MSTSLIEIRLPKDAAVDASSDRTFHESVKGCRAEWGLPSACFFKLRANRITAADFLAKNPEIGRIRQGRSVLGYAYQRHNAAAAHGEQLQPKRFNIRKSLADALASRAKSEGRTQTEVVEQALGAWLEIEKI